MGDRYERNGKAAKEEWQDDSGQRPRFQRSTQLAQDGSPMMAWKKSFGCGGWKGDNTLWG
jgi:hypothetical protein